MNKRRFTVNKYQQVAQDNPPKETVAPHKPGSLLGSPSGYLWGLYWLSS